MISSRAMVKFFTQNCPMRPASSSAHCTDPDKCVCLVKGQIVPSRSYADDKKEPVKEGEDSGMFSIEKDEAETSKAKKEKEEAKSSESTVPKKD